MSTRTVQQVAKPATSTIAQANQGVLQRKCACGTHTMGGGQCAECQKQQANGKPLQTKLTISEPGDVYEQEADRVAEQVMRMPEPVSGGKPNGSMTGSLVQRRATGSAIGLVEAPPIVNNVLNSPGQPLDPETRAFFEPRFGKDFSQVRVHADAAAERSAQEVNANAYTVGNNVVFGTGGFAPRTREGRQLLAHELAHVVQQSVSNGMNGDHSIEKLSRSPVEGVIQRQARRGSAGGCGICMGDPGGSKAGGVAHVEIQEAFKASNPNIIPEYPVPVVEEGKTAPFTPEVDLAYETVKQNQKIINIGEIKPLDDAKMQVGIARKQLQDYARELMANPELKFDEVFRMRDAPPTPLPFFNPNNPPGCPPQLIHVNLTEPGIYQYYCEPPFSELVRDPRCRCRKKEEEKEKKKDVAKPVAKPEQNEENEKKKTPQQQPKADGVKKDDDSVLPKVAVGVGAAATAAAAAYLRKRAIEEAERRAAQLAWRKMAEAAAARRAAQAAGKSAAGKTAGKVVVYAEIAAVAALIIFYSDRVEAKPGPGASAIESLYKAMTTNGTPPSPEMKALIESDPLLKQLAEDAASGGDGSKLQEEMTRRMLELIRDNPNTFTPEDLEFLTEYSKTAKAVGKSPETVDQLRKAIDAAKAGKTGAGGSGGGGDTSAIPSVTAPAKKEEPDLKTKEAPPGKEATEQITQPTRDKLAKAPAAVRDLFKGLLGSGLHANKLTDAQVQRFLSMVPPGLTADQVAKLLEKRKPVEGETADQVLDMLQAVLADLKEPAAPKPDAGVLAKPGDKPADKPGPSVTSTPVPAPAPNVTITTGPTVSGSKKTTPEELIKELAAVAQKSSFTDILPATYRVTWKSEEKGKPTVGYFISGGLRGKLKDGTKYVGRIEAEVTAVTGNSLKIKFVTATPMVGADGKVVLQADHFVDREDSVVFDPPKKK